jgi:uncharacterized protein YndB with AHSA1/START domain
MTDGTVQRQGDHAVIRFARDLPDPPAVVWRAITDRTELAAWFPCDVIVESWTPGSPIEFVFIESGMTLQGKVLSVDEPHSLAYTWGDEILRFALERLPSGGTRLVLTDELGPPVAARNAAGWEVCLGRLAGETLAVDTWERLFAHYSVSFTPSMGPQEGPPPGIERDPQEQR